jgi:uncharacterized protein (DUF433 family)
MAVRGLFLRDCVGCTKSARAVPYGCRFASRQPDINGSSSKEVFPLPSETRYEHILLDDKQVPMIAGTTMKVIELVLDHLAYGWSPEELHFQHPYLTMGQIHSALAYYWDHKAELDQDIERRLQFVDQVQQAAQPTSLVVRLKAKGLL